MKGTRFAAYAAIAIALLVVSMVAGCGGGGKISNGVISPYHGSLAGMATEPSDQETNIETSRDTSWIHVYWPTDGYPPPALFTVTVEKEESADQWGGIHTTLSLSQSDPINGTWWFQPASDFSPNTWYRIIIQTEGENPVVHYFQTAGTLAMSSGLSTRSAGALKGHRPAAAGDANGEDSVTHTITVPAK